LDDGRCIVPVVTVSRGSYSHGKEVAERVAEKLGYACISREVLLEASKEFNVPEVKLLQAVRDAPSFWDRFSYGKERYITYCQVALLEQFQKDNVVYHGLAGHFFVKSVSHVLKVRILAETEDRARLVMQREGMTKSQALRFLKTIDEERRKWGLYVDGVDTQDPSLYDLVIHIKKLSTADAAELICFTARLNRFQASSESQQAMEDLLLAARVRAALIEGYPKVNVVANKGVVYIGLEGASFREGKEIRDAARQVPGVKSVDLHLYPFTTPD
jgi:cytidylate kinase